jgi:ABC-type antimicrobial peptide transport system permease subunit
MVLLATGIVLLATPLDYVSYLLMYARRSQGMLASFQSIGLSRGQLMGLLGFEHLSVAAIGLGLGTWAGFRMSSLMVAPLAVTETGKQVVPPFNLTTDWSMMALTYVTVIGVFVVALFLLNRGIGRLDLTTATRVEE